MDTRIEEIVIVGGGTSGWMAAVYLNRALNTADERHCRITLIESSDIGTIGVGEATIPTIRRTFKFCGIDETEWMTKCNATFKLAIKFSNWSSRGDYWHPFEVPPGIGGIQLSQHWLKRRMGGEVEPFDQACFPVVPVCRAKRAPKRIGDAPYKGPLTYAYHLDAGLLATFLKERGKAEGVRHIVDNVVSVELDERGLISHLRTQHHDDVHGELFIDSSGFAGLLINQALGEPFVSYSDALLCDRAIAMPIPTDDAVQGINPFTSATALDHGWVWNTPLYGRSGNGYVYSSAFVSPDDAERELRRHLGPSSDAVDARHLKMRVGKTRNPWVKNCVAIGLAGGFIEPLESTGIWFIELGLSNLLLSFPDKNFAPGVAAKYNQLMTKNYEEIRDFITLHYCTTDREDTPFWKANKYHEAIPDSLQADLELWSAMLPNHEKLEERRFFANYSYTAILAGMGQLPERSLPFLDHKDELDVDGAFAAVKDTGERLRTELPDHYQYLKSLRTGEWPWSHDPQTGAERITICLARS